MARGKTKPRSPTAHTRACQYCRRRKIRCDASKPTCGTCQSRQQRCEYNALPAKPRPSTALLNGVLAEKAELERTVAELRKLLEDSDGEEEEDEDKDHEQEMISILSVPPSNNLIARAAISRQQEHRLHDPFTLATVLKPPGMIRGVPAEQVMHLLDLHWNRQHHSYLLTYRPVLMRELLDGDKYHSYCTDFLLFSVLACASKFSERPQMAEASKALFSRCEALIAGWPDGSSVLREAHLSTVVGLLLLGSTYNAQGQTERGWLYTGYALRMVTALYSQDERALNERSEDQERKNERSEEEKEEKEEIRRRVFWGAFICDKLQCLYLGRPPTLQLRDAARVPCAFADTYEELEPWEPYVDPSFVSKMTLPKWNATTHSVTVFQQLCRLAQIMARIIDGIYFAASDTTTKSKRRRQRQRRHRLRTRLRIDAALTRWYDALPPHLVCPLKKQAFSPPRSSAPNLSILHTTYHCLVVLLHSPFIQGDNDDNNDSGFVAAEAWRKCTSAAGHITRLALAYRATYPLRQSNYMLSYAVYVACTIHVHNVAVDCSNNNSSDLLQACLVCLDELAVPNSGVADTARRIRKAIAAKGIPEFQGTVCMASIHAPVQATAAQALAPSLVDDDASLGFNPLAEMPSFSDLGCLSTTYLDLWMHMYLQTYIYPSRQTQHAKK